MEQHTTKKLRSWLLMTGMFIMNTHVAFAQTSWSDITPEEYLDASSEDRFQAFSLWAGLGEGVPQDPKIVIANFIRIILGFIGMLLIILIIYGGMLWMTSAGNEQKIEKAKKILTNAVIGITIVFVSYAVASAITYWLVKASTG